MQAILEFFKNLWAAMTATAPKVTAKKYDFSQMPQLEKGSSAEAVIILKKRLIELGYFKSDKPTRDFYEETAKSVKAFQKDRGLTPDAVVGKVTWAELEKDGSKVEEKFPDETKPTTPSLKGDFDTAIVYTLKNEGGYSNVPQDSGGPTNFGITQKDYTTFKGHAVTAEEVKAMPLADAKAIYKSKYWFKEFEMISRAKATAIFDWGVLHGTLSSKIDAEEVLELLGAKIKVDGKLEAESIDALNRISDKDFINKFSDHLKAWFNNRVAVKPDQKVFLKGWTERAERLKTLIPKDEAKPAPPKVEPPAAPGSKPSWKVEAEKYKGKVETDAAFSADFRGQIKKRTGISIPTIATSTWAWCGFAIMLALSGVGLDYQKNGAMARDWQKYGQEVNWKKDGIPEGAIVQINHGLNCNSSSQNHVSMANGDCTVQDFFTADGKLKEGATIDLYGGNQGNTWRVSTYSAKEICTVRWPKDSKDFPKPGPILKSRNCTSGKSVKESTR